MLLSLVGKSFFCVLDSCQFFLGCSLILSCKRKVRLAFKSQISIGFTGCNSPTLFSLTGQWPPPAALMSLFPLDRSDSIQRIMSTLPRRKVFPLLLYSDPPRELSLFFLFKQTKLYLQEKAYRKHIHTWGRMIRPLSLSL